MNPNQEEHLTTPTEGIDALAPHGVIRGLVIMAVAAIVSLPGDYGGCSHCFAAGVQCAALRRKCQ